MFYILCAYSTKKYPIRPDVDPGLKLYSRCYEQPHSFFKMIASTSTGSSLLVPIDENISFKNFYLQDINVLQVHPTLYCRQGTKVLDQCSPFHSLQPHDIVKKTLYHIFISPDFISFTGLYKQAIHVKKWEIIY
jgi:hypothetical protein